MTYPSGLVLTCTYTSLGYAQQITGLGGQVYWTANARDAELHLTQQTAGNNVVTSQGFVKVTGRAGCLLLPLPQASQAGVTCQVATPTIL